MTEPIPGRHDLIIQRPLRVPRASVWRCWMHPDQERRDKHERMGFFEGWGIGIDQLEQVAGQRA